jgi:hypothetical protein
VVTIRASRAMTDPRPATRAAPMWLVRSMPTDNGTTNMGQARPQQNPGRRVAAMIAPTSAQNRLPGGRAMRPVVRPTGDGRLTPDIQ